MTGIAQTTNGAGEVSGIYLTTLAERHYLCTCPWVWDYLYGKFRLKYRNTSCLAGHWHTKLKSEK